MTMTQPYYLVFYTIYMYPIFYPSLSLYTTYRSGTNQICVAATLKLKAH